MGFDGQMVATTGELRGRGSCSLLFTRRSRRVSGLGALSRARVRCLIVLRRGDEEIGQLGLRWKGKNFGKSVWRR